MLRLKFRRSSRSRLLRASILIFIVALLIDLFSLIGARRRAFQSQEIDNSPTEKIFIASIHWNNEAILRSHWNSAVLRLVEHLGSKNVFVSVLESGSWDDSKGALKILDDELQKLGVARRIILEKTTHEDEITQTPGNDGWLDTAREKKELRRIPYLSRLRNRSLEPLATLAEEGTTFDRILFLNDVAFDVCSQFAYNFVSKCLLVARPETLLTCFQPGMENMPPHALSISRSLRTTTIPSL